jgi:diaminobutyrate-2-oxoglutarate transaminase
MQFIETVETLEPDFRGPIAPRKLYVFEDNDLLMRQRDQESNARSYPRRIPIALKRAKGIYVEDVEGRVFIDCLSAAGTLALGHNHPVVVEAIERALKSELPMQTLDLTTPTKDEFVQELFALLPAAWRRNAKIQFCGPAGTDAVEAALKLVKIATGRSNVLAFHGAYHGMSHGALQLMGNLGPKQGLSAPQTGVQFMPYPYSYRCPFGVGGEEGESLGLTYIRNLLHDPESGVVLPAAIILEPIQGEGGVIPASARWLRELRRIASDARVPLILDEIQTGIARTGDFFAFEQAGIVPDVLILSKAIGGSLPLSVIVYQDSLDVWQPGSHAGTFRGNQLAMAAGVAALKLVRKDSLHEHAAKVGARLRQHLLGLERQGSCVGEVRGRGLMLGMEIVEPDGSRDSLGHPASSRRLAVSIQQGCLKRGLIVELGGRHGSVVRFLPPLIVTEDQVDTIAEIVDAAVKEAIATDRRPGVD